MKAYRILDAKMFANLSQMKLEGFVFSEGSFVKVMEGFLDAYSLVLF